MMETWRRVGEVDIKWNPIGEDEAFIYHAIKYRFRYEYNYRELYIIY